MKNFLQLVAHTVDFVLTLAKRELPIALDVKQTKDIHFGASANYTLVQLNIKLSTVESALIFRATSLWDILKEHQITLKDREMPYSGLGFWHIERKLAQKNTLKWSKS